MDINSWKLWYGMLCPFLPCMARLWLWRHYKYLLFISNTWFLSACNYLFFQRISFTFSYWAINLSTFNINEQLLPSLINSYTSILTVIEFWLIHVQNRIKLICDQICTACARRSKMLCKSTFLIGTIFNHNVCLLGVDRRWIRWAYRQRRWIARLVPRRFSRRERPGATAAVDCCRQAVPQTSSWHSRASSTCPVTGDSRLW